MFSISNNIISIKVAAKGAELQSLYSIENKLEYLWSADEKYWAKKSPVLFPIVGGLKHNTYNHKGKTYPLSRHGFARDNDFELTAQTDSSLTFSLRNNEHTKTIYPFDFLFGVKYALENNRLHITFRVTNTGNEIMYFSVGAHPAFAVPLVNGLVYEDYALHFSEAENTGRWPLSAEGLIETTVLPLLENENILPLQKELFYRDAIVLKHLQSDSIVIVSDKSPHGVKVHFPGFPYMGIWAAKDANFVCIEPWCGIADSVNATGNLEEKEGIIKLEAAGVFERSYSVEVF